jgi:hypothetical protein
MDGGQSGNDPRAQRKRDSFGAAGNAQFEQDVTDMGFEGNGTVFYQADTSAGRVKKN